jgi:alpha-D-ribose 1-methylphosphonate 5-triphosphate synthase subunit PhnG
MTQRAQWMAVLAKADWQALDAACRQLEQMPDFTTLRAPETGLVMVRAKTGGTGNPFNMGEATVTRCAVVSDAGHTGHAYILGRNHDHARMAAQIDALMQDEARRDELWARIISPLAHAAEDHKRREREKAAATRVDFFTMVRGEDE